MDKKHLESIDLLYADYREVIKPLLAEIESNYEAFPEPIFNEIRAFNDHISRCFISCVTDEQIDTQLKKAKGHINRMIYDCYKYLNVFFNDQLILFEKQTKKVDLTTINNGEFYIEYKKLRREAISKVKEAKRAEYSANDGIDYTEFEESYNKYTELLDFIHNHSSEITWAKKKFYTKNFFSVIVSFVSWVIGIILGAILTNNNAEIVSFLVDKLAIW